MKNIHYTIGYGGKLNYHTMCGKEINSHSETEDATINPNEVTCKKCQKTKGWKQDHKECNNINPEVKRRIYIDSDVLSADEVKMAQTEVEKLCIDKHVKSIPRVFSEIIDYAWHDLGKTWDAIKKADEIYADSSLMPLIGGSYSGAPVIFNGMCERAIKENITGKEVYILNSLKRIHWDMIDKKLMKQAFKNNDLYMYNEEYELVEIDISQIKM